MPETKDLILRKAVIEDWQDMLHNIWSRPESAKYMLWNLTTTEEAAIARMERTIAYQEAHAYHWTVVEKATGQVFGSISVYNALLGEPQQKAKWPGLDFSGGIWEPGYCIGQKWWGKGFTTEALQTVVDFWFRQVGGAFLTCCHAVQNPASGRVMEKAGFVYHHNDVYHKFDGTPVECRCYLLTKEHYDNRKDLL